MRRRAQACGPASHDLRACARTNPCSVARTHAHMLIRTPAMSLGRQAGRLSGRPAAWPPSWQAGSCPLHPCVRACGHALQPLRAQQTGSTTAVGGTIIVREGTERLVCASWPLRANRPWQGRDWARASLMFRLAAGHHHLRDGPDESEHQRGSGAIPCESHHVAIRSVDLAAGPRSPSCARKFRPALHQRIQHASTRSIWTRKLALMMSLGSSSMRA